MSNLKSEVGRVAYPTLREARARKEGKKPRWSTTLVYDENKNLDVMRQSVRDLVKAEYTDKGRKVPSNFRSPFRPGTDRVDKETGEQKEGFNETDTFCEFWKYEDQGPVPIVAGDGQTSLAPNDIYAGCLARVLYRPFLYDVEGNVGAAFCLEAVQKAGDGEAIGRSPVDMKTAFDELEDAGSLADIL